MHHNTPKITVVDPRRLTIRSVDYWRATEGAAVEPRIERICRDAAGRPVQQWDARLWALQASDPDTPASQDTAYSLSATVLRTVGVDAGTQVNLYGLAGELLTGFDSRGTQLEIEYDRSLRPVAVFEQGVGQPRACVERFTYGAPGEGDQQRNQYGQLIDHHDTAGHVRFDAFALGGQCTENTRRFTRDPVTPDWPQLPAERDVLLETPPGATTHWLYGALSNVLEQTDAKGNRQSFYQALDGRLREARLQPKGQPEKTLVGAIEYNADGNIECETAGNGVRTRLRYRASDGRLISREDIRSDVLLQHRIYDYDRMGNVLRVEDKALPIRYFGNRRIDPVSRFDYDSLDQLISASGWEASSVRQGPLSSGRTDPAAVGNYRQNFEYDWSGNLHTLTHVGPQSHGRKLQAARHSNRCLPWHNGLPPTEAQIAAAFDARGNLLEVDKGRRLQWNLRNQLQSISPVQRISGRDDSETYLYDGTGQRVRKIRSLHTNARALTAEVRYLPGGLQLRSDTGTGEQLQVINAEAGLNSVRVLVWDSPPPASNHQYRYCGTDTLGSVTLETAEDGAIISRETFHPFGETAAQEGDLGYKFMRYSGKERDAPGFGYYGYRYYIPWLQRWLNPDPKGFVDGPNLYCMVGNSPVTYLDSDGGGKEQAAQLQGSVNKQQALLSTVATAAADTRNALLNHMFAGQRFQALGRRVATQLASSAFTKAASALGAAGGTAIGGLFGPGGATVGAMAGEKAGSMAAQSLVSKVVDAFQLERAINFKGNEMNPKSFIEGVEPKARRSFATIGFELAALDPRTREGRAQLGKNLLDRAIDKVGGKLGDEAPGLIRTGMEFFQAAQGLNAEALSQTYEQIPAVIDMLEFRTQAIKDELAESGSSNPQVFESIAELSQQTPEVVQALGRNQDFIGLVAPSPYAGNRHSLKGRGRAQTTMRRQQTNV